MKFLPRYLLTITAYIAILITASGCTNLPRINIGLAPNFQQVTEKNIADGLAFYQVKKGVLSQADSYVLSSQVLPKEQALTLSKNVKAYLNQQKKFSLASSISLVDPTEKSPNNQPLGKMVQFGTFASGEHAAKVKMLLHDIGSKFFILHTSLRSHRGGPFNISIMKLLPEKYSGKIISALGKGHITGVEKTSDIAKKHQAVAAINAGFFVFAPKFGVLGDPAGIAVIDGQLVSEAVASRPALLIKNEPELSVNILENVTSKQVLTLGKEALVINGVNRALGKILNCGQTVEQETLPAAHDRLCENNDEIIVYNDAFGDISSFKKGNSSSFLIDENNKIYNINEIKTSNIPYKHFLIRASGKKAEQLNKLLKHVSTATVTFTVESESGVLTLEKGMYIINGGPSLLIDGINPKEKRAIQGWRSNQPLLGKNAEDDNDKIDKHSQISNVQNNFYHSWVVNRHPRTAVGITKNNEVYFIVVYGRNPEVSAGASISELSNIMKSLHVEQAINLDGGGSSIMVINGKPTGTPSDNNGERAIGDALLFINK